MEKFRSSCDKEIMKMAMLRQEEIFREQVYELHRLYQLQKILMMKNISRNRKGEQNQERWIHNSSYSNNLYQIHQPPRQNLDWQQPDEEQVANVIEDECDIELTLGLSSYHPMRKAKTPQNGANDINEQLRKDRLQQPPCLLQGLSMDIT